MVLTVPNITIDDGSGYRMSYGEATKRAPEASVLKRSTLPQGLMGLGVICDPNRLGMKFPTGELGGIEFDDERLLVMSSSRIARGKACRLRDKGRKLEHGNPDWLLGTDPS